MFIQIVQCSKNYLKNFLPQEAGAFRKETVKAMHKIEKLSYIFTDNIGSVCNPIQIVIFCKMY